MLQFCLANIEFCAFLLILKINLGFSQFSANNTQVLEITDEVQNLRFASAEEKILNIGQNNETVAAIIKQVYANTENNSKIILNFSHGVVQTNLSFQILKALKNEMKANNHTDPLQLILLYYAFEDDVIFKKTTNPRISPEMEIILDEIKASVKTNAKQILKTALFTNTFDVNDYVQNVTKGLFNFFYEIDDAVMQELANETYPDVPAVQLVENVMFGSNYIPQKLTFFLALYEKLERNNDLNNDGVLKIAYFFRILKNMENYQNAFQPKKYAVNEVIKRMPICARNLYFAHNLCIWNRGRSEYLFADISQHNFSRRGIFTYDAEDLTRGGIWNAKFYANVYFESSIYHKEYLHASTTDKYNPVTRHVLTWVDDGFVGDTSAWKIELHGDFCYIKNVNFNEYLFTSEKIHDAKRRYVFTAINEAIKDDQLDFQWQIRNCG